VVLAFRAPVDAVPLVGFEPLQPPLAVQELALVADQVSVELLPEVTALGPALSVTVGAEAETVTVTDWVALPAGPLQVRTYVWDLVRAPVVTEPEVALAPVQAPDARQAVALADTQERLVEAPLEIVLAAALRLTVGGD
jgi:hypothetical protein